MSTLLHAILDRAPALATLAQECKGCHGTLCKGCHGTEHAPAVQPSTARQQRRSPAHGREHQKTKLLSSLGLLGGPPLRACRPSNGWQSAPCVRSNRVAG